MQDTGLMDSVSADLFIYINIIQVEDNERDTISAGDYLYPPVLISVVIKSHGLLMKSKVRTYSPPNLYAVNPILNFYTTSAMLMPAKILRIMQTNNCSCSCYFVSWTVWDLYRCKLNEAISQHQIVKCR